eukprot:TRINITY_DN22106_c0_g1_i1.p2 TRINITY_DN22106_c0_g1~~TRINITY_DN22106_c0_g1_i1.p2  ORF type:complete len:204 (+),score=40.04 TRINITY_DN22106_c0_g1_i1:196-807(+)
MKDKKNRKEYLNAMLAQDSAERHKFRVLHIPLHCHYCRTTSRDTEYVLCADYPRCKFVFCLDCAKLGSEHPSGSGSCTLEKWLCLACRGECLCIRCKTGQMGIKKRKFLVPTRVDEKYLKVAKWRDLPYLQNESREHGPKEYQSKIDISSHSDHSSNFKTKQSEQQFFKKKIAAKHKKKKKKKKKKKNKKKTIKKNKKHPKKP